MSGPNYSSYSLEELHDAKAHVDREKYPERFNKIVEAIQEKSKHMTEYKCIKCGYNLCDIEESRSAGGALSQMFDVQNMKFTTITCKQCKYTEFYRCDSNSLVNFLDFMTN